jgi:hypothetical protein
MEPDEVDPNVGMSPDEFALAFEDIHRHLGIPLPDPLTW